MAKILRHIRYTCLLWINRSIIISGLIEFKPDGKTEFEPKENWQTDIPANLEKEDMDE